MWNPFKKKQIDPDRNIVDELVNKLSQEGDLEKIENALIGLKSKELNDAELESWHHMYGICAFQRSEHDLAAKRLLEGLHLCPNSNQLKFSLAQEYIFLSRSNEAFPLFDECVFPSISREFALAMSRYAYLFSEYDRGIKYLENFFEAYKEVKILDDHFLYVRGLPFFGTAWSHLAAHCILSQKVGILETITNEVSSTCHDYDFDFLGIELRSIVTNDFSAMIEPLRTRIEEIVAYGSPTGYIDLRLSVFESFSEDSYQGAIKKLDSVKLGESDFPWLADIRTLAKAEAASRFKETVESELLTSFLKNQSMLFEPDHAVSFGLLSYQELLKPKVGIVASSR